MSDNNGTFQFNNLEMGEYQVWAQASGYRHASGFVYLFHQIPLYFGIMGGRTQALVL